MLNLGDGLHVLELVHGYWSGRRLISLDGNPILQHGPRIFNDGGSHHELLVGPHEVELHVRTNGFWFTYHCLVDGRELAPELARPSLRSVGQQAAVSAAVEPGTQLRLGRRVDRFISFDGWLRGDR